MKYFFAVLGLILLLGISAFVGARHWVHELAKADLRASHNVQSTDTDYDFITRGVTAGMTYDEVAARIVYADKATGLNAKPSDAPEPYYATFEYTFRQIKTILGMEVNERVSEQYDVYFNDEQRAIRIRYNVYGNSWERLDVDLVKQTLSEPLEFDWRD